MRLRTHAGFRLFWTASTVSDFGTPITTLAIQGLVVTTLSGSAAEVGLVNAARWLPYLLFGVLVGALADRARRKPLLVGSDLGRAALLCAVPLLARPGLLTLPTLAALSPCSACCRCSTTPRTSRSCPGCCPGTR
jgi:MFS family permease